MRAKGSMPLIQTNPPPGGCLRVPHRAPRRETPCRPTGTGGTSDPDSHCTTRPNPPDTFHRATAHQQHSSPPSGLHIVGLPGTAEIAARRARCTINEIVPGNRTYSSRVVPFRQDFFAHWLDVPGLFLRPWRAEERRCD